MVDKASPYDASDGGEVQGGLHHLAQSNETTFYSPNLHQANEESRPLIPHQQTSYGIASQSWQATLPERKADLPESSQDGPAPYQGLPNLDHHVNLSQPQPQNPRHRIGLGVGYDDHNAVTGQYPEYGSGEYANMSLAQQTPSQEPGHAQSSPTPVPSDHSPGTRRTRSGRALGNSDSKPPPKGSKVNKSPQAKKAAKASKREKLKAPQINAPLSELTQSYTHVEIKDMDAWVNRPAEVRWREVEKRNGHVARPMNSFMLYRSAYAERTKMWCLQNNHQVVSSVSGESWPMETPEIREKYDTLAKIERQNHQNAHPGYKFSPSKSNNSKKRKTGTPESPEAEESETGEVDGLDEDWNERGSRGKRSRSTRRTVKNTDESANDLPYIGLRTRPYPSGGGQMLLSYQATNSGMPVPNAMEPNDIYGQYYQAPGYPHVNHPYVQDAGMHRTDTPASHQSGYPGLVGLPGAFHQELYAQGSSANTPAPLEEHLVDPMLLGSLNNFSSSSEHLSQGNALPYHTIPNTYDREHGAGASYGGLNSAYALHSSLGEQYNHPTDNSQAAGYHGEMQGSVEHGADQWPPRFDAASEFEKWYDEDH